MLQAKRDEEEARLAEVEGLVDLLQKEPGPFKSPPLSPEDGEFVKQNLVVTLLYTGEYFTKIRPPPSGKKSASWQKLSEKS